MKIKAATTKRLIKEVIQNLIITDIACIILAHESKEYIIRIVKKAIAQLESDNEIRAMNRLKPRNKLTGPNSSKTVLKPSNRRTYIGVPAPEILMISQEKM